uniref:Beta-glucosidase 22 n=1 Tax=Anthurium amnicola TaxID=1678845 RepID=A0A1D1YF46_9ARAE
MMGWTLNPVVFGDYPEIMKKIAGSKIPSFTQSQSKQLKGSIDFLGLNHYVSAYIADEPNDSQSGPRDYNADISVRFTVSRNQTPSGQLIPFGIPVDPPGLQRVLEYFKQEYGNPPIYVQENGYGSLFNGTLNDTARIDAIGGFIGAVLAAIRNGSNARGYIVWSFVDCFELLWGYLSPYGIYHVDFEDRDRKRQPRLSAIWYRDFLMKKKQHLAIQSVGWLAASRTSR